MSSCRGRPPSARAPRGPACRRATRRPPCSRRPELVDPDVHQSGDTPRCSTMASVIADMTARFCSGVRPADMWMLTSGMTSSSQHRQPCKKVGGGPALTPFQRGCMADFGRVWPVSRSTVARSGRRRWAGVAPSSELARSRSGRSAPRSAFWAAHGATIPGRTPAQKRQWCDGRPDGRTPSCASHRQQIPLLSESQQRRNGS